MVQILLTGGLVLSQDMLHMSVDCLFGLEQVIAIALKVPISHVVQIRATGEAVCGGTHYAVFWF